MQAIRYSNLGQIGTLPSELLDDFELYYEEILPPEPRISHWKKENLTIKKARHILSVLFAYVMANRKGQFVKTRLLLRTLYAKYSAAILFVNTSKESLGKAYDGHQRTNKQAGKSS